MALNLVNFEQTAQEAIKSVWLGRDTAKQKQLDAGRAAWRGTVRRWRRKDADTGFAAATAKPQPAARNAASNCATHPAFCPSLAKLASKLLRSSR